MPGRKKLAFRRRGAQVKFGLKKHIPGSIPGEHPGEHPRELSGSIPGSIPGSLHSYT